MEEDDIEKPTMYLAGSYNGKFRNSLIKALPEYQVHDSRNHRQSCTAKTVCDDMKAAEKCPILLSGFLKNNIRGTTTYSEIADSFIHGNYIFTIDENTEKDPLLKKISVNYFDGFDEAINFFKNDFKYKPQPKPKVKSKYPAGTKEPVPLENIYFCGEINSDLIRIVKKLKKEYPGKNFIIKSDDVYEDFKNIEDYDLIVANFLTEKWWDRYAFFMIGGAYAYDISVLSLEDERWGYPTLRALVRRHGRDLNCINEYILNIKDLNVDKEVRSAYNLLSKGNGKII
jgi:hypothetical protein